MTGPEKIAYSFVVSNEMLADLREYQALFSWPPPPAKTPEEIAEISRRKQERATETAAFLAALAVIPEPVAQVVLDLHKPMSTGYYPYCDGCDEGDYAEGPALWPCRTVEAVANHYSIPVPTDIYVPKEDT